MRTSELLAELEYADSPNFLGADRFGEVLEYAHVFRRAAESFRLHGVYLLREQSRGGSGSSTPVLYVAEAKTREEADDIHRKVWNQNVVPFLLVRTSEGVRLYSGFRYEWKAVPRSQQREQQGILEAVVAFNEVAKKLSEFRARSIDDGTLWQSRGHQVEAETRVDWRLLDNLERLGNWLHKSENIDKEVANSLIGKFVYLRYLRDRGILSDRKLREWGIDLGEVLGREATMDATQDLIERVNGWLNGEIFPFPFSGRQAPELRHIRRVAEIFLGDEISGQLHLDFKCYDFSYIPIETLSVIYEQFLASEGKDKASGAYYTPIPLVNFMLSELDDYRPLQQGMRVLDPACGSGAFLVQCYRRLIERRLQENGSKPLRPAELRDLLVKHIFGIDHDANACRVASLSLILTMLDYIKPPDLQGTPNFKLPDLHNRNIFHGDFFDPGSSWCRESPGQSYDWIIGNPPWQPAENDFVLSWIREKAKIFPVVGNQAAEAFAWKAVEHIAPAGRVALLLPAMSLFKQGKYFRRAFFQTVDVLALANFSNLRRDLFGDRVEEPAVAIFYASSGEQKETNGDILVYSPLLASQELGRPARERRSLKRKATWAISLNSSEIRQVSSQSIANGNSLPWKIAMWGSPRDLRLMTRIGKRWPSLGQVVDASSIPILAGIELKGGRARNNKNPEVLEPVPEVKGKRELKVKPLRDCGRIYSFPPAALEVITPERSFARKGRGKKPLVICKPPHVVVSGARTFAVFSDEYIAVPSRQIGIAGNISQRFFLIALSLYLSSDFAHYYEFFQSPQGGIKEGRSTLKVLRSLPCPVQDLDESQLRIWSELHAELVLASTVRWPRTRLEAPLFDDSPGKEVQIEKLEALERDLNNLVGDFLGLTETERWLVHDLVHVRSNLADGNVGEEAVRKPTEEELAAYGEALRKSLDEFISEERHRVTIVHDGRSGIIEVILGPAEQQASPVQTFNADDVLGSELAAMRRIKIEESGQSIYFDRNLYIYRGDRTYLLKPMQRVGWTRSQALMDADEILAGVLAPEGG